MNIEVTEASLTKLPEYGRIPIAFEVRRVLDCTEQHGLGGITLTERVLDTPYVKDYDRIAGEGPQRWCERFDTSHWALLMAKAQGRLVGGATLAFDTPGVDMLEGRQDLVVLWDIRVCPEARRHGIGSTLFRAALAWARAKGCRQLKVETQNVNVPACRFYAGQGCVLGAIHRFAYPSLPEEIQLLWYKDLALLDSAVPLRA
jgi:GNAT superfamily N-acetyltransferase